MAMAMDLAHRRPKYRPPPDVQQLSIAALIGSARSIPEAQQKRFDYTASTPGGLNLWCAGDTSIAAGTCVSIVGTRKVSAEGRGRARRLARELAELGVVIVSGLAEGVDTEAMTAADEAGGNLIGVIGTGIDRAYPAANAELQERIYSRHLLVSQFAPGSKVFRGNFPQRNKLMAAISDATVIIEASDTSGTLHQAAECRRLGRPLFIANALIEDHSLEWPARFLTDPRGGVYPLTKTHDIVRVLRKEP